MCKHDEGMGISTGLVVTCFCHSYYCPGEDKSVLLNEAESGLTTVASNVQFQSVCEAFRTVCGDFYDKNIHLLSCLNPCYLRGIECPLFHPS